MEKETIGNRKDIVPVKKGVPQKQSIVRRCSNLEIALEWRRSTSLDSETHISHRKQRIKPHQMQFCSKWVCGRARQPYLGR